MIKNAFTRKVISPLGFIIIGVLIFVINIITTLITNEEVTKSYALDFILLGLIIGTMESIKEWYKKTARRSK